MDRLSALRTIALLLSVGGAAALGGCIIIDDGSGGGGGRPLPPPGLPPYSSLCRAAGDCDLGLSCVSYGAAGSMCTNTCATDAQCFGGGGFTGACYALAADPSGQRLCYQRCNADFDCDVGQYCADASVGGAVVDRICLPGSAPVLGLPTYSTCATSADCTAPDVCARIQVPTSTGAFLVGQQCTRACASDLACPAANGYAGACYMLSSDPDWRNFFCYARCDSDLDCNPGWQCIVTTMGGVPTDSVCMPR